MSSLCSDQDRLEHPVFPSYPAITSPSSPCHPGPSIVIDSPFDGPLTETHGTWKKSTKGGRSRVTIDMLPDVALLEIFDFYVDESEEEWHTLVHVCRNWRNVVFESPKRLGLRLYCGARTPVSERLDVWPLLPIVVRSYGYRKCGIVNIVAALEHNDRICSCNILNIPSWYIENILAAMQQPFPELTCLRLEFRDEIFDETGSVVPASFLGGSAPALQELYMTGIPFPGLPKLLLSTTRLVILYLWRIPHSGYFSPETMVTCLSVLTSLDVLRIEFESPQSRPDRRRPPPPTRTLLPVLTELRFEGASEYLEDLVARIDAPLLNSFSVIFFHRLIFDAPQLNVLNSFISRTPKLQEHNEARVVFSDRDIRVILPVPQTDTRVLNVGVSCTQLDWQVSSLAQVCSLSLPQALIPVIEHLYIHNGPLPPRWQDNIENSQWLELFHPFIAVKNLYISSQLTPYIAPVLQELAGERVTEVLPALQTLFWEGPVEETIGKFIAGRQLAGLPIAVSHWEGNPFLP